MNEETIHKAKASVGGNTFEFEGSREYVEKQIEKVLEIASKTPPAPKPANMKMPENSSQKSRKQPARKSTQRTSTEPKMLANLVSKDQIGQLKDFYSDKKPSSHMDICAVFSYWLKTVLGLKQIGVDEIWTLYKIVGERPPRVLIQTLRDAKFRKSHFDLGENGKYYLTALGETFVEYDLPAPSKEGKKQ